MRTRTKLTSPPGQEPVDDRDVRGAEGYAPAFDLPREPKVPSRHRRLVVWLVVIVALALAGWIGFRILSTGQSEDPSLQQPTQPGDPSLEQPADPATP